MKEGKPRAAAQLQTLGLVTDALSDLSRRPDWSVGGPSIFTDLFSNTSNSVGGGAAAGVTMAMWPHKIQSVVLIVIMARIGDHIYHLTELSFCSGSACCSVWFLPWTSRLKRIKLHLMRQEEERTLLPWLSG